MILDEAKKAIATNGIDGLKLTTIADAIGIRQPSIYAHFSSRSKIIEALCSRIIDDVGQLFDGTFGRSSIDSILRGVDDLVRYVEEHPAEARLLARDISIPGGYGPVRAVLGPPGTIGAPEGPLGSMIRRLQRILDRGCKEGSFRRFQASVLFTLLLGITLLAVNTQAIPSRQLRTALHDLVRRVLTNRTI